MRFIFFALNKMPSSIIPPIVNTSGQLTLTGATALLAALVASQRFMKKRTNKKNNKKSPRRR